MAEATTILREVVDRARRHPGLLGKAPIGLVAEAFGPTDWLSGPGDDGAVIPDGAPTHMTTISIEPGRRRVELPPGVAITGRVEVDGEIPKETIRLWANATNVPVLDGSAWDALDGEVTPRVSVFPSGQFELLGLAKASEWTFNPATEGYRRDEILLDDKPVANLIAPAAGVVIKLSRMPLIRGRVVSGDPPVPVPKATCSLAASW